ncbi:MAG TPA: dTMP kinase [Nitrospiraceae bacterium]|jgi:dTMP kinase|nr:dTMP kinase [Nitrospiraceae bacterium]
MPTYFRMRRDGESVNLTRERPRGVLITLEGVEGSGKTTQIRRLARLLREDGHRVLETREPGGTPLAEAIRRTLLRSTHERMDPRCEALLILAARSQHIARVIKPALDRGIVVLCDRFVDSTLAYQGYGRGLDVGVLRRLNRFATGGLEPDLSLLFDLPVGAGLTRRQRNKLEQNRLDRESRRFHNAVRRGFLELAAREPSRIVVLDGTKPADTLAEEVAAIVRRFLRRSVRRTGAQSAS